MPWIRASAALALLVYPRRSSRPLVPPLIFLVTVMISSRSQSGLIFFFFQYSQAILRDRTGVGGHQGVFLEVDTENGAQRLVICPSGQLNQAPPLIEGPVTLLDIAEVLASLVRLSAGEFLGGPEAGRLMAGLPQEVRDPQSRIDPVGRQCRSKNGADLGDDLRLPLGVRSAEPRRDFEHYLTVYRHHGSLLHR